MKTFRIQFDVPETKLATVVSLISGEVSNLVIRDTAMLTNAPPPVTKAKRTYGPRTGKSCVGVAKQALAGLKVGISVPYSTIINALLKNGYTAATHTSVITKLVQEGVVERQGNKMLRIVKALA